MGIKSYNPYTPSRRHMTGSDFSEITKATPEKSLTVSLKKNAGRNNQGKIQTEQQTSHLSAMQMARKHTFLLRKDLKLDRKL